MGVFDVFKSFINPSLALGIVRGQLEKQLNKKIPYFDLIYISEKDKLQFIVDGLFYDFLNESLKTLVKHELAKHIKKNQHLDIVKIAVDKDDKIKAQIFFTEDNEKKSLTYNM